MITFERVLVAIIALTLAGAGAVVLFVAVMRAAGFSWQEERKQVPSPHGPLDCPTDKELREARTIHTNGET